MFIDRVKMWTWMYIKRGHGHNWSNQNVDMYIKRGHGQNLLLRFARGWFLRSLGFILFLIWLQFRHGLFEDIKRVFWELSGSGGRWVESWRGNHGNKTSIKKSGFMVWFNERWRKNGRDSKLGLRIWERESRSEFWNREWRENMWLVTFQ